MNTKFLTFFIIFCIGITITNSQENKSIDNPYSQSKFVPDISLIIDLSYNNYNLENHDYELLMVPSIINNNSAENHSHAHQHTQKGFNLNYGELYISSVVDPYFDLTGIFHISRLGFELEEGYFITRKLPLGLQLKGGKFFSAFGRINEQHPHVWDFADKPTVFKSFFGSEGLNEVGLQLNWIAPTSFYLNLGFEVSEGENESSFGKKGFEIQSIEVEASEQPNLYTGFISTSFDVEKITGLLKLSGAFGKTRKITNSNSNHVTEAIFTDTKILGLSLYGKYLIDPNKIISFQSEYLYRTMQGNKYFEDTSSVNVLDFENNQSGFYSQLIYKFDKRWRFGIRYDYLQNNLIKINQDNEILPKYLPRYSAMIDFSPTEFSVIRFQYSYDKSKYIYQNNNYIKKEISEFILQLNLSIGAHGAHPF